MVTSGESLKSRPNALLSYLSYFCVPQYLTFFTPGHLTWAVATRLRCGCMVVANGATHLALEIVMGPAAATLLHDRTFSDCCKNQDGGWGRFARADRTCQFIHTSVP